MAKDHKDRRVEELGKGENAYLDEHIEGLDVPSVTWWKDSGLRRLYAMMPILFLGSTINGYDGSLLNGLQTMVPWQEYFNHPSGSRLGLFTAIQNIGGVCAVLFSSYAADVFGRRIGVCIGLVIVFVGTVLQVVPTHAHESMFIGGRFLVGLGSNVAQGSAPLLIMELAHPQHRGKLTTMYNTLWYVGSIIAAWTVFGTVKYTTNASWRIPVGLQGLMPAIQFALIFLLPESPRWLLSKDRPDEALAILIKASLYHACGDANNHFVRSEFHEIQETLRLEKTNSQHGWSVFLKTPGNRKRLLLIALVSFFSQCSGNGLVSYYLHSILLSVGITGSYNQSLINGGLQVWSFLVAIFFSLSVDKIGRRMLFMIAAVGMLITFTIWTACSAVYAQTGNTGAGSAVVAMIFLFYGVAGFAWPGLTVAYCAEILPFNIRAKGLAINFALTALASVFNQYGECGSWCLI
ncbi:general substrate transporter [Cadophora sp. DSE1049]|nr:general substrate transporter [Cadophora sp. DSE1049]